MSLCGKRDWDRGPLDIPSTCSAGRFRLRKRQLGAAHGGLEALLVPRDHDFELVVDAEPPGGWDAVAPMLRAALARHRLRFRVAHEWAHSFFYLRGAGGISRRLPDSPEQERFCDEFARALLVPRSVAVSLPPHARSVCALQERFDVSLELAARALAHAHPQAPFWLVVLPADELGEPFVQWRSSASYRCAVGTRQVLKALRDGGQAPVMSHPVEGSESRERPALNIDLLSDRRQALVFAS